MEGSLRPDRLFGGLTRPATLFGLPADALIVIAGGSLVVFLIANMLGSSVVWKIGALGTGVVFYGIARLVCLHDPRAFRYIALQLETKALHRTRTYWKSGSYAPLPQRRRRHTALGHKEEVINMSRALTDYVPYSAHIDEYAIRTVGGHTLAVIRLDGVAHESADDGQIQSWHDALMGLVRNIAGDDVALWIHMIRDEQNAYPAGGFEAGFAADLDAQYRASLSGLNLMANIHYITLLVRGRNRFASRFRPGGKDSASVRERIRDARDHLEQVTEIVMAGLGRYGARRLGTYERNGVIYSEALEFLAQLINGRHAPVAVPRGRAAYGMVSSRVSFGMEQLEIRSPAGQRVGAMLGVSEYEVERTGPGHLNMLLTLPFPFVLAQSFSCFGRAKSLTALRLQLRRLENAEDASESQIADLRIALDDVASNRAAFGEHHLSLQVLAASTRELNERVSSAQAALIEAGFTVVREDECIEAAFFAQLPGNFRMRPRPCPISSSNLIAFTGFHNYPNGLYDGNQWGPAITLLKTTSGTPFYFNFHVPPGVRKQRLFRASEGETA